ncbi:hypothetical protein AAFF_G00057820 [Aldrovandia affinis]|uniref:Uncharacterized protein n=1 Tax=Aldrovandia affinis TaxID=143900 RepID=A0AAD7S0F2_9TELE|nr:hypothetical protein AAFF_G00057820 [Aldrovandia affinis]
MQVKPCGDAERSLGQFIPDWPHRAKRGASRLHGTPMEAAGALVRSVAKEVEGKARWRDGARTSKVSQLDQGTCTPTPPPESPPTARTAARSPNSLR